jgi:hypothetical protein
MVVLVTGQLFVINTIRMPTNYLGLLGVYYLCKAFE